MTPPPWPALARATGLLLGFAADRLVADPARWHPVAGFGTLAAALEHRTYADDRAAGIRHVALLVGAAVTLGVAAERTPRHPVARTLVTAVAAWTVLGGTSLDREAAAVQQHLDAGDLGAAREQVTHLVGRDPSRLDAAGVARASVESVAENTSDAVVAPLFWGALAGAPGLLGYRAANTLDAMVGHHSPRYERFGWAAARLDDALNLPGARLTAGLGALLGDDPAGALRAWRRDAGGHPSPNAGPVEASFAGALGIRLGGRNVYAGRVEDRAVLGDGRDVRTEDIGRARHLATRVDVAALGVAVALTLVGPALVRAVTGARS